MHEWLHMYQLFQSHCPFKSHLLCSLLLLLCNYIVFQGPIFQEALKLERGKPDVAIIAMILLL